MCTFHRGVMGRAEQIERRQRRGRSESYEIDTRSRDPVRGTFTVKGRSGRAYQVTLWDPAAGIQSCSCPDFATNALGTCKHLEAVVHHLETHEAEALRTARAAPADIRVLYLDGAACPPKVRLHGVSAEDIELSPLARQVLDAENSLPEEKAVRALLGEVEAAGVSVAPEARAFLEARMAEGARRRDLAGGVEQFRQWREALVARRDRREPPDPSDEVQATWVKRFADLPDWSLDGAEHLVRRGRALLGDDPGLDKIAQALAAAEFLRLTGRVQKILITCPASRRHLWRSAVRMRTGLEPRVIGGVTFDELARSEGTSPYAVVPLSRLYRNFERIQATEWSLLVVDEAQRIKSWPAPTGKAIKAIGANYAFVLTSGDLSHRPADLFYTVQLLDPYLLGPAWAFDESHIVRDARGAAVGVEKMDEVRRRLAPLWLARRRCEVETRAGRPRTLELLLDVTHAQHRQMDPVLRTLLAMTRTQQPWSAEQREGIVDLLEKIRTICTAPELVRPDRPGSPKLEEVVQLVEDFLLCGQQKVTLLCRDDALAEVVLRRMEHVGLSAFWVRAGDSLRKRRSVVKKAAGHPDGGVLLVSDEALEGLDLAAASHVAIHVDLPWHPDRLEARRTALGVNRDEGCRLEVQLLCTATPEQAAAEALRRRRDQLSRLILDPQQELAGLRDAEEPLLRELIELVVDERMVLRPRKALLSGKGQAVPNRPFTVRGFRQKERMRRAQVPQQRYLIGEGESPAAPAPARAPRPGAVVRRSDRPARTFSALSSASQVPAAGWQTDPSSNAAGDVVVLGLETREDRMSCSQPSKVHTLGLAMVVTYSFRKGEFTAWKSEYMNDLVRTLLSASLVVGYNPHGFEYKVLGPYTGRNLARVPTVDLLLEITKAIGKKLPFDLVTGPTLDKAWTADRSQASMRFQQGQVQQVATLCTEGTRVVRDLFLHVVHHKEIRFRPGPHEEVQTVSLDLGAKINPAVESLLCAQR